MSSPSLDPNITPALAAPVGFTSNLVNPPSQAYVTIVVQTILLVLATPFVFVRLFTRFYVHHGLWWDDGKSLSVTMYTWSSMWTRLTRRSFLCSGLGIIQHFSKTQSNRLLTRL